MDLFHIGAWKIFAGAAAATGAIAVIAWMALRRRLTPDEIERARRGFLTQHGRISDGMLLDLFDSEAPDGRTLRMLAFSYRVGGVDHECSQDITALRDVIDPLLLRIGFPCSVRYQTGNPHNSIVVAEQWSGLRGSGLNGPGQHEPDLRESGLRADSSAPLSGDGERSMNLDL